jgi:hypothetical protein
MIFGVNFRRRCLVGGNVANIALRAARSSYDVCDDGAAAKNYDVKASQQKDSQALLRGRPRGSLSNSQKFQSTMLGPAQEQCD